VSALPDPDCVLCWVLLGRMCASELRPCAPDCFAGQSHTGSWPYFADHELRCLTDWVYVSVCVLWKARLVMTHPDACMTWLVFAPLGGCVLAEVVRQQRPL
jgi:hypothetical protein